LDITRLNIAERESVSHFQGGRNKDQRLPFPEAQKRPERRTALLPLQSSARGTDKNFAVLNPNIITRNAISPSICPKAIANVELEIMPRTPDDIPFQLTFGEWPPLMRTDVVDREKVSRDMKERNGPVLHLDGF